MRMTKSELSEILRLHAQWSEGNPRGVMADLSDEDLSRAILFGADLWRAVLVGASLEGADLREANLYDADLFRADLTRANLAGADLRETNLSEADLKGANITGCSVSPKTIASSEYPLSWWMERGAAIDR